MTTKLAEFQEFQKVEFWILDENHNAVMTDSSALWAKFFENRDNRRVAKTTINDEVFVSTVFLGIDHGFGDGPPLLFETMVFGGEHNQYCQRYTTWAEAEVGHQRVVTLIKEDAEFI